jgi:DNA-3-methyladenine glycosylase
MERLQRAFYARDTVTVARDLLGQRLVRLMQGRRLSGRIVEVEAYVGEMDSACHAHRGKTARNAVMFGPPGHAYVYSIYGMHHCFNVVTDREGYAAAVLVRALEPLEGVDVMRANRGGRAGAELTNGPAKLCYALGIDRALDGVDLVASEALWLERGELVTDGPPITGGVSASLRQSSGCSATLRQIASGPRVGVRGDDWALAVEWRFWIWDNPYVSKR